MRNPDERESRRPYSPPAAMEYGEIAYLTRGDY